MTEQEYHKNLQEMRAIRTQLDRLKSDYWKRLIETLPASSFEAFVKRYFQGEDLTTLELDFFGLSIMGEM